MGDVYYLPDLSGSTNLRKIRDKRSVTNQNSDAMGKTTVPISCSTKAIWINTDPKSQDWQA